VLIGHWVFSLLLGLCLFYPAGQVAISGIPVVIAGVATAHFGLHRTALAYCVAMAALIAGAAGSLVLRRLGAATGAATGQGAR
jgi:hypothetical protein